MFADNVGISSGNRNFIILILLAELMLLFSFTTVRVINNRIILYVSTRFNLSLVSDFQFFFTHFSAYSR